MDKIQKSTIIFSAAIIVLAAFSIWQQVEISQIKNAQPGALGAAVSAQKQQPYSQLEAVKNDLLKVKNISGTVVSSSGSEIVVKTKLVDFLALDKFDFKASLTLPSIDKNLTVKITNSSIVRGGKPVAGVSVGIQTKEPIYSSGTLTAVSVDVLVPPTSAGAPQPIN